MMTENTTSIQNIVINIEAIHIFTTSVVMASDPQDFH